MGNGSPVPFYHRPLWSGVFGGLITAAVIAIAGFMGGGGLVGALGGVTRATLGDDIQRLKQEKPAIWALLKGDPGENGATGAKGDTGQQGLPGLAPPGVVVASTKPCDLLSTKWKDYDKAEGRFLIGAGKGPLDNPVTPGVAGGNPFVTLQASNIPTLKFRLPIENAGDRWHSEQNSRKRLGLVMDGDVFSNRILVTGGSTEYSIGAKTPTQFEILPPYVPLYFCKYDG